MPADPIEPRPARLARLFPWVRIGRAPGIALDSRKLVLAAVGLGLLWAGWEGIDRLFQVESRDRIARVAPGTLLDPAINLDTFAAGVIEPFQVLISPFVDLFRTGHSPATFSRALSMSVWAVMVWGIVGGAIARIAAVQAATGERMAVVPAVRFALRRWAALIGAPLSPLIGIGLLAGLCALVGILYRIPGSIGTTIAGVILFLPLLAGLMMTLLVAGLAVGWPLMTATVAVEGEDAFDALSRSYSYVTQRPGRYAAYAAVAWVVGGIGLLVVRLLTSLTIHLAHWGLAIGGPDPRIGTLIAGDPAGGLPALAHGTWIFVVRLLAHGWAYSYFFTAATIIYTLIRRDVDGAPYQDLGGLTPDDEPFAGPAPSHREGGAEHDLTTESAEGPLK